MFFSANFSTQGQEFTFPCRFQKQTMQLFNLSWYWSTLTRTAGQKQQSLMFVKWPHGLSFFFARVRYWHNSRHSLSVSIQVPTLTNTKCKKSSSKPFSFTLCDKKKVSQYLFIWFLLQLFITSWQTGDSKCILQRCQYIPSCEFQTGSILHIHW